MERIEIGVKFGRRKQTFRFRLDLRSPEDLRRIIKAQLKLQIPKDLLVVQHQDSKTFLEANNERQFREKICSNDLLLCTIRPFDIGTEFVCSSEELGNGAFSQVYKGHYKKTGEVVAIKVVDAKSLDSAKTREYHAREKKIFSSLNHPNIVNLRDMVQQEIPGDGTYYYFVMEFCNGGSLDAHIYGQPLNENQVRRMMNQLASAFKCLTDAKIVHRDLKPQNILLSSKNLDEALLKLCDFGFSRYFRSEEDESTIKESLIRSYPNTPLYAAPDLLQRKPYDAKCDLWSLGVIMFEMLAGTALFQVKTLDELENAVRQTNIIKLPNGVHISADCMDLLKRLLEKDANKRIEWHQFFNHPFLTGKAQRIINCIPLAEQYGVEVDEHTNVGTVKAALERQINIRVANQMLLTESGIEVADDALLNTSRDRSSLYLYNRNSKDSSSQRPMDCQPILVELKKDPFYVTLEDKPIEHLLKFQHQCHLLLQNIREYLKQSELVVKKHEGLLPRLHIQSKGLKIGIAHLDIRLKEVQAHWNSVWEAYSTGSKQSERVLASFEECLEQMSSMPLHPSLCKSDPNSNSREEKRTLRDCVDYPKLVQDFARFKKIHSDLSSLTTLHNVLSSIPNSKPTTLDEYSELMNSLKLSKAQRLEILAFEEFLEKKYHSILMEVKHAREKLSQSSLKKEAIPANTELIENCDSNIATAAKLFQSMNTHLIKCIQAGNTVQQRLSVVGDLAENLRQISQNLVELEGEIVEEQKMLQTFDEILRLPDAYTSYISEMNRRRTFQVNTILQIEKLKSHFATEEVDEASRLAVFSNRFENVLRKEIFPGLDLRSQGHVEIRLDPLPELPIAANPQSAEAISDEFLSILDQGVNVAELRRENSLMRSEILAFLQKEKEKVLPADLLSENMKLRENSDRLRKKLDDLRYEYEQRFQKQKDNVIQLQAQINAQTVEAEKFKVQSEDHASERQKALRAQAQLDGLRQEKAAREQVERQLKAEKVIRTQLEAQLAQSEARLRQDVEYERSNSRSFETSLRSLSLECQELREQKKKMSAQMDELNDSVMRQKKKINLQEKEIEKFQGTSNGSTDLLVELERVRNLLKAATEKNDKLMNSMNLRECPFCMQFFPEGEIEKHVHSMHS